MFASSPSETRPRRAGDATLVGLGLLLLLVNGLLANRTLRIEQATLDLIAALPSWAGELFAWSFGLGGLYAIWLILATVASRHPRLDIARDLLAAAIASLVMGALLVRLAEGAWPIMLPEMGRTDPAPQFPVLRVAIVTAVVAVAAVHIVRPLRRVGWIFVTLVAISGLGLGLGVPTDALGGVGLGLAAGGAVLLLFGSPAAQPDVQRVAGDLAQLGLSMTSLCVAEHQTWGMRTLTGEDASGRPVLVKVYGPDARDAQLIARAWRFLWYRDEGSSVGTSRLQQVEHEALVTILAANASVPCPGVVRAALSDGDDAILVLEDPGTPLSSAGADEISDEFLERTWAAVRLLHDAGISHGSLQATNIRNHHGSPVLTGFGAGSLSATSHQTSHDVVSLLADTAHRIGVERAVAVALAGAGEDAVVAALPYVQVPALSSTQRRPIDKPKELLGAIRQRVMQATGVEEPEPAKLRRVNARDLVFTGLIVLAAYFLIHQLAGLDLAEIWASMRSAELGWAAAAFIAAQLILIPNATGLMAAVSAPIPLRPTIILQSAIQFIGLAVPSSAGRIATNVAYLRKFGVSPVAAITQGALDSFTGFLVQAAILLAALLFGDLSFGLSGDFDINWTLVLGIAVAVIVAGAVVVFAVASLRERLMSVLGEVVGALRGLLQEPRRAIALFASNFGSQLALAISMWLTVRAFGESLSLATSLVIVVGAVLLGGVAPTPGGVGVQEAVLAAGLVSAGIAQDTAFAIAVSYRLFTFFLPPTWGFFSFRWLEKHGYV